MGYYRYTWLFFILLFAGQKSVSQNKTFSIDHIDSREGFLSAQAIAIVKSSSGFLWVGTEQGLYKFDGHHCQNILQTTKDSSSLDGLYIQSLAEDKNGHIWVGAYPDVFVYQPRENKLIKITPADKTVIPGMRVYEFLYIPDKHLMWLCTDKGLWYVQGTAGGLRRVVVPGTPQIFHDVALDADESLWLTNTYGLFHFDWENCISRDFHRPESDPAKVDDDGFFSIYDDGKGSFWLGTWVNGLIKMDKKTHVMESYLFGDIKTTHNGIVDVASFPTHQGDLWLATVEGIKIFNPITKTFYSFPSGENQGINRISGGGLSLWPTTTEGIWIGTTHGLYRFDPYKNIVFNTEFLTGKKKGQGTWNPLAMERLNAHECYIWAMIPFQTFYLLDAYNENILPTPKALQPFFKGEIWPYAIFRDDKNCWWFSAKSFGIVGYDPGRGQVIVPEIPPGLPPVLSIVESPDHKLILGTTDGLYMYDQIQNVVTRFVQGDKFFQKNHYSTETHRMDMDKEGMLWLVCRNQKLGKFSLIKLDTRKLTFTTMKNIDREKLMEGKEIEEVKILSSGQLVMSSSQGFLILDPRQENATLKSYRYNQGKPLGYCKYIAEDDQGKIWISNDVGLIIFDQRKQTLRQITSENSNLGRQGKSGLLYDKLNLLMYIGEEQKLEAIHVNLPDPELPSRVVLSEFFIPGTENLFTEDFLSGKLVLDHLQNQIHFAFSNTCYTNADENVYEYILNNSDTWLAMNGNTLDLSALSPGHYTMVVRSSNSFGNPIQENLKLIWTIKPPWYLSIWFQGLVLVSSFLIMFFIFRYREKERKKLETLRHTIARDLHDDMGSSLSHIKMLSEKEARAGKSGEVYETISAKITEVMSNMSEIIWAINPEKDSFEHTIIRIQEFAVEMFEPKGVELDFQWPESLPDINFTQEERRQFYLLFKEAIHNSFKYSQTKKAILSVEYHKGVLKTTFRDFGIGFDPQLVTRGNGLKNMKHRANILGGEWTMHTSKKGSAVTLALKV